MSKSRATKTGQGMAIVHGRLIVEGENLCGMVGAEWEGWLEDSKTKAIRVESLESNWSESYWNGADMSSKEISFDYTMRKEKRWNMDHWYAYKRRGGKLYKRYVGKSEDITPRRLADVARMFP